VGVRAGRIIKGEKERKKHSGAMERKRNSAGHSICEKWKGKVERRKIKGGGPETSRGEKKI